MVNCPDGYVRNKSKKSTLLFNKCCKKKHDPSQIHCLMTEEDEKTAHDEIKSKPKTELKPKTKEKPSAADTIKEILKKIEEESKEEESKEEEIDIVLPPPPPLLKRALSSNITKQTAGDCFAHASTRVFLRMISREFFEKYKKDDPFHSIKENACDDLYLIQESFSVFSKKHDIESLCTNPGNYNSILMYFFLHKITIDKFDCQGGMPDFVLFYLLRIFNDLKNERITLNQICDLGNSKYCDHLQPLITSFNQIETKYTAPFMHYTRDSSDTKKSPEELIEHQNKFFDKIQEIIDLGLYVSLSINGLIPSMKTPTKTRPNARTHKFSQSDLLYLSSSDTSTHTQLSRFLGNDHAVTIVDYDYSNPSDKQLKIKNSWGKPEHGNDIYIYISKNDLDLSPDQVCINYLEPTNEYSLFDLAILNESIYDKLPPTDTRFLSPFKTWNKIAIIFNSTNTIDSFFARFGNTSIERTDIMSDVLSMSTNNTVYGKMVSQAILRNVFDCIISNLKRYNIYEKMNYGYWIETLNANKKKSPVDNVELNTYFERELKKLVPSFTSYLTKSMTSSINYFSKGKGKPNKTTKKRTKKRRRR